MKKGFGKAIGGFVAVVLVVLGSWAACSTEDPAQGIPQSPIDEPRADHVALPEELPLTPDEYYKYTYRAGKLERFDYQTTDPDDATRVMDKYAIVYLPYGYRDTGTERYDIVYLMHGTGGTADTQLGTPEAPTGLKYILDNLIANGDMEPMIVVSVSYYPDNKVQETDDYDAQLTLDFGDELRNDLMPALESRYRTYAEQATNVGFVESRSHRVFGGFSMGAVTAWYRACDSMDYFKYYIPVSGSLMWGTDYASPFWTPKRAAKKIIADIVDQGYDRDDFFVFTAAGDNEEGYPVVTEQTEALQEAGYPFVFDDEYANANMVSLIADGEIHDYHCYNRILYTALPHISAMMHVQDEAQSAP